MTIDLVTGHKINRQHHTSMGVSYGITLHADQMAFSRTQTYLKCGKYYTCMSPVRQSDIQFACSVNVLKCIQLRNMVLHGSSDESFRKNNHPSN